MSDEYVQEPAEMIREVMTNMATVRRIIETSKKDGSLRHELHVSTEMMKNWEEKLRAALDEMAHGLQIAYDRGYNASERQSQLFLGTWSDEV